MLAQISQAEDEIWGNLELVFEAPGFHHCRTPIALRNIIDALAVQLRRVEVWSCGQRGQARIQQRPGHWISSVEHIGRDGETRRCSLAVVGIYQRTVENAAVSAHYEPVVQEIRVPS